jgi:hypothetical protein
MKKIKKTISTFIYRSGRLFKESTFPLTKNGKTLQQLRNIHLNRRCFIIGNGPSLKPGDLDRLKHEITFAFNRIYYIFDKTDWRPTYYFSEDNKTVFNSIAEINNLDLNHKFFPVNFPWDYNLHFKDATYYIFKFGDRNKEPDFSGNLVNGIYWGNTVAYSAIQMAVYMGIKEIYLLGVDHNFSKTVNDKGEIVIDHTAKDYFSEKYNVDKEDLYIPNTEASTRAFRAAKKYADQHNIRIYNATRGGKLEVFERVDFDKIF